MKPHKLAALGAVHGRRWYAEAETAMLACGKGDRLLGAAILAATSPRCGLVDNVRRALRGTSPFRAHAFNLTRAHSGEPLSGPKVKSFHLALLGDVNAVPVDTWMLRAYGFNTASPAAIREVTRKVTAAARRKGESPRDYAASIWCGILLHHGREPLTYNEVLARLRRMSVRGNHVKPSDRSDGENARHSPTRREVKSNGHQARRQSPRHPYPHGRQAGVV